MYFYTVHWPGQRAASSFRQLRRAKRECNATSALGRGCARSFLLCYCFRPPFHTLSLSPSLSPSPTCVFNTWVCPWQWHSYPKAVADKCQTDMQTDTQTAGEGERETEGGESGREGWESQSTSSSLFLSMCIVFNRRVENKKPSAGNWNICRMNCLSSGNKSDDSNN